MKTHSISASGALVCGDHLLLSLFRVISAALTIAPRPVIGVRFGLVVAGIVLWYVTQTLLGKRVPKVAWVDGVIRHWVG